DIRHHEDTLVLGFTRRISASQERVWAWCTDPDNLSAWIGTWTGDPASGEVSFTMTSVQVSEPCIIQVCAPPNRLRARFDGLQTWLVDLQVTPVGSADADSSSTNVTDLRIEQFLLPGLDLVRIGPSWDYYLDRLVAHIEGRPEPDKSMYGQNLAP